MATIKEQIKAIRDAKRFIRNELPKQAKKVAKNDLVALITNRVVQKGESASGAFFSSYSTKQVAAFRFVGKSRINSADKKIRAKAKKGTALSYKEFRKLNNLKSDKKNFEFTNEMWRKFGIVTFASNNGNFSIVLGGRTKASQDKINDNSGREKISIIEASKKEVAIVTKTIKDWLLIEVKNILEI